MTLGLHRIGVEVRPSELKTRHAMQAGKAPGKRCRRERSPIPDRAEVVPQISPSTRFSFSGAGAAAVETGITPVVLAVGAPSRSRSDCTSAVLPYSRTHPAILFSPGRAIGNDLFAAAIILSDDDVTRLPRCGFSNLEKDYCSFVYSALASFRMGMSGSASFQSVRKSL